MKVWIALPLIALLAAKSWLLGPGIRWRRWFAWHPIEVSGERVWLRWVDRQIGVEDSAPDIIYRFRPSAAAQQTPSAR